MLHLHEHNTLVWVLKFKNGSHADCLLVHVAFFDVRDVGKLGSEHESVLAHLFRNINIKFFVALINFAEGRAFFGQQLNRFFILEQIVDIVALEDLSERELQEAEQLAHGFCLQNVCNSVRVP